MPTIVLHPQANLPLINFYGPLPSLIIVLAFYKSFFSIIYENKSTDDPKWLKQRERDRRFSV